jgi:hypothetical protein
MYVHLMDGFADPVLHRNRILEDNIVNNRLSSWRNFRTYFAYSFNRVFPTNSTYSEGWLCRSYLNLLGYNKIDMTAQSYIS